MEEVAARQFSHEIYQEDELVPYHSLLDMARETLELRGAGRDGTWT
eukprot:gene6807-23039_t